MCHSGRHLLLLGFVGVLTLIFVGHVKAELKPSSFCENHSEIAKAAMRARQSGAEMSTLIKKFDQVAYENPENRNIHSLSESTKDYIEQAYGFPLIHHEDMRQGTVLRFGNIIYRACYRALREARRE
jgi:hypothetical protein